VEGDDGGVAGMTSACNADAGRGVPSAWIDNDDQGVEKINAKRPSAKFIPEHIQISLNLIIYLSNYVDWNTKF